MSALWTPHSVPSGAHTSAPPPSRLGERSAQTAIAQDGGEAAQTRTAKTQRQKLNIFVHLRVPSSSRKGRRMRLT